MMQLNVIFVLTALFGRLNAQECMGCDIFDEFTAACYSLELTSVSDCLPKTLTYLDLWNNSIALNSSTFDTFSSLEMIFIESNGLLEIPEDIFRNQPNLTTVGLNRNYLTTVSVNLFTNNPLIKELQVTGNHLKDLDIIFVANSLNIVYAYFNNIETLSSNVPMNGNISYLDISYNNLTTLDKNLFANMRNAALWVEENPWNCDCALSELQDVFQQQGIVVQLTPSCATPPELAGESWDVLDKLCGNETSYSS